MKINAEHRTRIVQAKAAERYGHPTVGARCTCGWRGILKIGPHATEAAEEEARTHLASIVPGPAPDTGRPPSS
jgi:hypothetical protein